MPTGHPPRSRPSLSNCPFVRFTLYDGAFVLIRRSLIVAIEQRDSEGNPPKTYTLITAGSQQFLVDHTPQVALERIWEGGGDHV